MEDRFTVFVEGVDLLSSGVQDLLEERLDLEALLGREGDLQFLVYDVDEDDAYDLAVERAVRDLTEVLPELRITEIRPGRYGSIDIR
ncbi:MAG: hypothetical protein QOK00_357 [Thermoleophilaceae bacterium]|jgi:hypothetical protein|nr:hypothetical protein [Thermoleophilaceae bacterium]